MNEQNFIKKVTGQLDRETENLDAATLSRLNQGRQAALQQLRRKNPASRTVWMPATGLAAAVLLISVFLFKAEEIPLSTGIDEIEIIASNENLDLYEKLDFYIWLAEEEMSAG